MALPKSLIRKEKKEKKSKEDEHALADLSSAHRRLQGKCQLVQTCYMKQIRFLFLSISIINILLTEFSRSVWENLDLGCVYRPHCGQDSPIQDHTDLLFIY